MNETSFDFLQDNRSLNAPFMEVDSARLTEGKHVEVCLGPLKGVKGVLVEACDDHRWLLRPLDAQPGVYLCMAENLLTVGTT